MRKLDELEALRSQICSLEQQVSGLKQQLIRAKDPSPVIKPSFKRVLALAINACMDLKRVTGGWLLSMGKRCRTFKKLSEIWELLSQDDWSLSDILPAPPEPKPAPVAPIQPKRNPSLAPALPVAKQYTRQWWLNDRLLLENTT